MTEKQILKLAKRIGKILRPKSSIDYVFDYDVSKYNATWEQKMHTRTEIIVFYMLNIEKLSDEEIIETIVHEHIHSILSGIHNTSSLAVNKNIDAIIQRELELSVVDLTELLYPIFLHMLEGDK